MGSTGTTLMDNRRPAGLHGQIWTLAHDQPLLFGLLVFVACALDVIIVVVVAFGVHF